MYLKIAGRWLGIWLILSSLLAFSADCEREIDSFCVSYYNNTSLEGDPVLVETESVVSHFWRGSGPGDAVKTDGFSARWRGWFNFEEGIHRFRALADDGVRVMVNGESIIEAWVFQAARLYTSDVFMAKGLHLVEIEYFEATGQATLEASWSLLKDQDACDIPDNTFCAAYFPNTELEGKPQLVVNEDVIDHQWANRSPMEGIPADGFSARYQGRFIFESGYHTFTVVGDDGVRLWVNDQMVINGWRNQAATTYQSTIHLDEGPHVVRLEYFERTGQARVKLDWKKNNGINTANTQSPLGVNISALNYFSTEWTLMDAMKSSGGWFTQNATTWNTREQERLDLDENGWVRSLPEAEAVDVQYEWVGALMLNGTGGRYPAGQYVVLYEGEGQLGYGLDARYDAELSRPGRHVLNVETPSNAGIVLRVVQTNPDNYIRNIRVIMPGYSCGDNPFHYCESGECGEDASCVTLETLAQDHLFHPRFLSDLAQYRVVRFMDFLRTNTTTLSNWEDRPQMSHARWNTEEGAPIELAIELANQLNADAWLTVPVRADDNFVAQYAQLVLDQLNPGLRVYVEYSNEIWNTVFSAGYWVEEQALALWPDVKSSRFTKRMNYYGKRSAEIMAIWKGVWGEDSHRVIGVMGGQASNTWVNEQALACPLSVNDGGSACSELIDMLAIAPYFGGYVGREQFQAPLRSMLAQDEGALDALFQELELGGPLFNPDQLPAWSRSPEQGALEQAFQRIRANSNVADKYGVQLGAYEAGQHLAGVGPVQNDNDLSTLFVQANRDPRMGELYTQYLDGWKANGGGLMCHFLSVGSYSRFGSWGAKEHQTQEDAPKYKALEEFMRQNPCWWSDCETREINTDKEASEDN